MENANEEWIGASELAKRIGVSTQTVYNRVKNGLYESKTFRRGKYIGMLIKYNLE